jgi:hypothetical protein
MPLVLPIGNIRKLISFPIRGVPDSAAVCKARAALWLAGCRFAKLAAGLRGIRSSNAPGFSSSKPGGRSAAAGAGAAAAGGGLSLGSDRTVTRKPAAQVSKIRMPHHLRDRPSHRRGARREERFALRSLRPRRRWWRWRFLARLLMSPVLVGESGHSIG